MQLFRSEKEDNKSGQKKKKDGVIWLDELFIAIQNALLTAHRASISQHIETLLDDYFERDSTNDANQAPRPDDEAIPQDVPQASRLNAKTIPLNIPQSANSSNVNVAHAQSATSTENDQNNYEFPLDVPMASLVPHNSLLIDEVTINFECILTEYSTSDTNQEGRLALRLNRGDDRYGYTGMPARVSIRYKMGDPPEGVARINDQLTMRIP